MNLGNEPESKNYVDRTAAPWYDPNKLLAAATVGLRRVVGDPKQAYLDKVNAQRNANPLPPMDEKANYNSQVTRDPSGRGWILKRPGQFDEFAPDYTDSNVINGILKSAGITK